MEGMFVIAFGILVVIATLYAIADYFSRQHKSKKNINEVINYFDKTPTWRDESKNPKTLSDVIRKRPELYKEPGIKQKHIHHTSEEGYKSSIHVSPDYNSISTISILNSGGSGWSSSDCGSSSSSDGGSCGGGGE